jgi:hypothetical protein
VPHLNVVAHDAQVAIAAALNHLQALWGPKGASGRTLIGFLRSQIALRALERRRPGKRRPGTPLASCVVLARAWKLPVNRTLPRLGPDATEAFILAAKCLNGSGRWPPGMIKLWLSS